MYERVGLARFRASLACSLCLSVVAAAGCTAGVKHSGGGGGTTATGSGGGAGTTPAIPGLASLAVTPATQTITLTQDASGAIAPATAMYIATGTFADGSMKDVTGMVQWLSTIPSLSVRGGVASVTAPGTYTLTAKSGTITASAKLLAKFTGTVIGAGFSPADKPSLDGAASGTASIAYPLDGALFPSNLGPIYVHLTKTSADTAARLSFTGDQLDVTFYGVCEVDAVNLPGGGCYVKLPLDFAALFVAASENGDITLTARVGGSGKLAETAPIKVAWSNVALTGGLYYWTTIQAGVIAGYQGGTGIQRYNFDKTNPAPELVYTDQGTSPLFQGSPPADPDGAQCIGCHAISNDGAMMALTIGGSEPANIALLNIATKKLLTLDAAAAAGVTDVTNPTYYKQFRKKGYTETTFGPMGDRMVNMYRSKLFLNGATAALPAMGEVVPSFPEYKSDPFWSQDGKFLVFTAFATPDTGGTYNLTGLNGDMKRGGQIVIADADAMGIKDNARILVPRDPIATSYYPAISNDSKLVVYNKSVCGVDPDVNPGGYGTQTCDGYDDSSATLWLTAPEGKAPLKLNHANGGERNSNSWPRWSPDNGSFRGQRLYWIAFSSRRAYGLQVNTGTAATSHPQMWFAGVVTGDEFATDPSFAPVWLPNQNQNQTLPNGNHVPQWVKVAVPIPQ